MHEPIARHALAETGGVQQIDGAVFENAGPNAPLAVLARAGLNDDRLDPGAMKQVRKYETSGAGPDNSNLSLHGG
jgi:hypothetical protein